MIFFSTDDFTIQWYQKQQDGGGFWPRVCQFGGYNSGGVIMGVSIEGGTFIYWENGRPYFCGSVNNYNGQWSSFAITRQSGVIRVYYNGLKINEFTGSLIVNNNGNLVIGNESTLGNDGPYKGLIANFYWIKGEALYTSNTYTVHVDYPTIANTSFYLLKIDGSNNYSLTTSTQYNITPNSDYPIDSDFIYVPPPPPEPEGITNDNTFFNSLNDETVVDMDVLNSIVLYSNNIIQANIVKTIHSNNNILSITYDPEY